MTTLSFSHRFYALYQPHTAILAFCRSVYRGYGLKRLKRAFKRVTEVFQKGKIMYYDKELWDMVERAALYSKESDGSFTKICDVKDIDHINLASMSDRDDSMTYAEYIFKSQETYRIKAQLDDFNNYIADQLSKTVYSYKVICTTKKYQNRTHHKYRTNKKWAKRYGYTYVEVQHEPIIFMNGTIFCTKDGLEQIKKICK